MRTICQALVGAALGATVIVSGCQCGEDAAPGGPTEQVSPPRARPSIELEPLPDVPPVEIPPEALPGADGKLTVVAARPQGPVRGEVRPTVTFSKPVKSLADVEGQRASDREKPFARIEPALEGAWRWLGSASAEFVPKGLVPYSTEFTVTVNKGLRAIDGSELEADYVFRFSTPKPELQDVSPAREHAWVKPDDLIKLVFNQPVKDLQKHARFEIEGEPGPWKVRVVHTASIAEERRAAEAQQRDRRYERMGFEDRGFKNQQTRYELRPEKPFPLDRQIRLVISADLPGAQGPLTLGEEIDLSWRTYGPLTVTKADMCIGGHRCATGPLILHTSNPVDLESVRSRLKITPAVEIDWDRARAYAPHVYYRGYTGPHVSLPGNFEPGTTYTVELSPGVKDEYGQTHDKAFRDTARTDDLAPALHTGGQDALIETALGTKVPVEVVNLRELDVRIWNLTHEEMARVLAKGWYDEDLPLSRPSDFHESQKLNYPRNVSRMHAIDLSKVFGASKTGLALLQLRAPEVEWQPRNGFRVLVQVTNLATHFKLGPAKSLVWVTELTGGAPVPNATVVIHDNRGRVRWTGTTNDQGLADVPGAVEMGLTSEYEWDTPFAMAAATVGTDTGVSSSQWSEGLSAWDFNVTQGWEGKAPHASGFVFTDRGIYRPGDKVYVKGLARYRTVGTLTSPAEGSTLVVLVRDSKGDEVVEREVKVTRYGTFSAEAVIPKEAPTGSFSVEVTGKTPSGPLQFYGSFRVEEYRAPQFKVDVQTEKPHLLAAEKLNATVFARYLFGGAMNDAKVRWSVHRTSDTFSPAGAEGFTFGQQTWWWDDNAPGDYSGFFASGEGLVNEKGALELTAGAVEAPGERTYTYTVEAEVEDINRQTVANRAFVRVHPAAYYVGLRAPTGFRKADEDVAMDVLVTDVHGKRVGGRPVEVEIVRRSWKSVRQKDASGGLRTVSEPVEEKVHDCQLTSRADGPVQCVFKPGQAGFYITRATVADEARRRHTASLGLYVTGAGFVAWQRNDTERIELVPDKAIYDVGDVAKVLVKSPYPQARALLTIEREGVLERRVLKLEGSVQTVDIPITEAHLPNVFVGVVVIRPRVKEGGIESGDDPGRPAVRVGLVKLQVERSTRRLAVDVQTDRTDYRPGEEVTVNVAVKNHIGRGVPAEVTLYVVDEAVLRLTAYKTPDPLEAIFPERPLSVRFGEPLIHLVRKRSYGEKGEEAGGGGADPHGAQGSGFRSNFQTTVLFNPTLETSEGGTARATFKLPDNLTTFRIMAVAVSRDDRFGSGDRSIQVNKPLLALPALPRFARVGDRFEAGIVVHAHGVPAGEAQVTAQAENARLLGPSERRVEVAEGRPREVRFPFTVETPGIATFRFRVQKGGESDGVEVKIPVELPVGMEAVATYGDTKDVRVEGIAAPKDVRTDVGGLEITLASTALGNLQEGFRQLVEYPYGCVEQQASRLIPFVALRELAPKFGIPWTGPDERQLATERELNAFFRRYLFDPLDVSGEQDPDEVIRRTITAIFAQQTEEGSFNFWSDAWCPSSYASAYATLALHRAHEVGYPVDSQKLARAQAYLERVATGGCNPCELGCPLETRVFAAYTLARMKAPKASTYGEFFARRNDLSLFSRALLADAMFVGGGNREQARQLLQEILDHAKESPRGVHFEEIHQQTYATMWHSDTRTTGAVLQTLTTLSPDHPYVGKIAQYLTGVRQAGKWRSTQEAAFSLIGLTEMVRTKEKDTPDFTARVLLGDQRWVEAPFKGRSTAVRTEAVPMSELLQKLGGGEKKLSFQKDGTGVLYYSALMRYAPKEVPMKALENGLYVQRWFEPYAGGGQTTRAHAGDLVRVRLRVASNQERHFAVFEVPLPAGLEPVDTSLATTARQTRSPDEEQRDVGYEYESDEDQYAGSAYVEEPELVSRWTYGFWTPFNHVEQRDQKVVVFADHLPPGIHVTSFVARATTPGTFLMKPAHGELMYEPEVFGRSAGGTFEVLMPQEVSAR